MTFHRKISSIAACGLIAVFLLLGQVSPARADDVADGRQLVSNLMTDAMRDFGGKVVPPDQRGDLLRGLFAKYGDIALSSQDILGRFWGKSSPEEQAEFKTVVVDYAIGSWAKQMSDLPSEQKVNFTSSETTPEGRTVLHSLIESGTDTTPVDWIVAHAADGHLVVSDVSLSGVSVVQTMKADFGTIIRANGGKLSALLDAMKAKIASYSTEKAN